MNKITKLLSLILYGLATLSYCLDNIQTAIYLILSAIYISLGLLTDEK